MSTNKSNPGIKPVKLLKAAFILIVLSLNVGCDQVSKNFAREHLTYHEEINFMNHCITLTKVENGGAFLSLGDSLPDEVKSLLLTVLPIIVLLAGIVYIIAKDRFSGIMLLGLSCIAGGGIGNIYDRALYGTVTDFLHIDMGLFETGIFNMADVSIVIGMFLVLLQSLLKKTPPANQTGNETALTIDEAEALN